MADRLGDAAEKEREGALGSLEPAGGGGRRLGYRSPALAALGVPHLFTTRGAGELADEVGAAVRRAAGLAPGGTGGTGSPGGPGPRLVRVRQVHGSEVVLVRDDELPEPPPAADALVTERPDRLLAVSVADCVPVLAASPDGRRVAAIHAGWRGLVAGVIPRALEVLGAAEPVAALGPCLSLARFEVGPEVAAAFDAAGLGSCVHAGPGSRPHVDLRRAAALQLARGGARRIDASDRCTWEDAAELFSFRRDVTHGGLGSTGRQGALIAPAPGR